MSARLESFLARLYVDEDARAAFLADPDGEATRAALTPRERADVGRLDPADLRLAATGFARKRAHPPARRIPAWWCLMFRARCLAPPRREPSG
jgi:hypothetical protein